MESPGAGFRSMLARVGSALPRGRGLPEALWRRRHRGMVLLLVGHVVALFGLGALQGVGLGRTLAILTPLALVAAVAGAQDLHRRLRTAAVAAGLVGSSAALVHLTGGVTESHFHVFVMIAVIALYQEWLPLLVAVGVVASHHALIVLRDRGMEAVAHNADPAVWLSVQALYVSAAAAAGILTWRLNEEERGRTERILHSTAEGICGIDEHGTVTFANQAMARLLQRPVDQLVGQPAHGVCGHANPHGTPFHPTDCRICGYLESNRGGLLTDVTFVRADGSAFPVEITAGPPSDREPHADLVMSFRDLSEHAELAERALRDQLTRLPNRTLFLDHLTKALARLRRRDGLVAVMFLDLDRFKVINDSLGHAAGDALLVAAAERLETCVRTHDTVARFGGDEFVILCEDLAGERDVLTVADRIVTSFAQPFRVDGKAVSAASSIGIAVTSASDTEPAALIRDADAAMYRAKEQGRGRYEVFDEELRHRAVMRMQTESDLWRAIARDELVVHYQPIVALEDESITGVEALVRWNHPTLGLLEPPQFLPVAIETGLVVPIGTWVLEEACRQMQRWRQQHAELGHLELSVNMSAPQLRQPGLAQTVKTVLERTGLPQNLLTLEVSEEVLTDDTERIGRALEDLHEAAIAVAIDDFGTGYSSLASLSRLPARALKIDEPLIAELDGSDQSQSIVRAIIGLARTLNLRVVAEGVETPEQVKALQALGCDLGQGTAFAAPAESAALFSEGDRTLYLPDEASRV